MDNLENNVIEVAAEATQEAAKSSHLNWKVIGIVAGITALTGGVAFGTYKFIKTIKAKKAAKAVTVVEADADTVEVSK